MRVFIAGDSTAAYKARDKRPETGWGEKIPEFFDPSIDFRNFALNGRSTKSFIDEGHLMLIEAQIRAGDWLIVQFGHNDEKDDPARHSDPDTTFRDNLAQFVRVAREAGAHPLILSSIARRNFTADGPVTNSHGVYPEAMRDFAAGAGVPYIDINLLTIGTMNRLGPNETKKVYLHLAPGEHPNYPEGVQDNTHLQDAGARLVASLIAESIAETARSAPALSPEAALGSLASLIRR
jgi:lysophospholipase L1-like esterase